MKNPITITICILVLLPNWTAKAQDNIVTFDQPGYSTAAFILPKKTIQFEFGTSYNEITGINETIFPSLLIRVPVLKKAELRFTLNYEPQSNIFILDDVNNNHDPIAVGFKYKIAQQKAWRPSLVIMANAFYPVQILNQFVSQEMNADLWLIAHNFIGEKHELFYSAGYTRGNVRLKNMMAWTFCYNYMITNSIGVFAEYFGFLYSDLTQNEHGFSTGITYEFGQTFQLDACYYYNIDQYQELGYISAGISYNLNRN
jgi:hypothetical protein